MTPRVQNIIDGLEALAPRHLAEDWDNVGLQVGDPEWTVAKVLIALDPSAAVVEEAIRDGASAVVTHHPLIFRPLRSLNLATVTGRLIQRLVEKRVAVITAHTNLDSVSGGVNDVLVERLALQNIAVLQPLADDADVGLGRVGALPQPMAFESLVRDVKSRLGLAHIRCAGQPENPVQRVAVCSGSGGSLIEQFLDSPADVFITGDVRYHDAREIESQRRGVIDIGHFESEHIIVRRLAKLLDAKLTTHGFRAVVQASACEETPFKTL
ncbi:MAG: Nif3-like dinuclear metal center hexameric protein [Desulfobacterales bacterium]|nr:Nif3-like dinuclear metal center hexameric protein [Desulfobacterales bacterium]